MVAPVIAAAGIGALGSVLGGKGQAKAIKKAAKIQQQTAREQIAANDRVRAENFGVLQPMIASGNKAGSLIDGILYGGADGQGALAAFNTFKDSGNYNFRFDEGMRALNTGYAGKGVLESGAGMKAAMNYGQNTASGELGNWMNMLAQRQNVGIGAAGAYTGQNIQIQGMNNATSQNAADAMSNARLMLGQNTATMWNSIGSSLGSAIGGMGKTSYGGGALSSFGGSGGGGMSVANWIAPTLRVGG